MSAHKDHLTLAGVKAKINSLEVSCSKSDKGGITPKAGSGKKMSKKKSY